MYQKIYIYGKTRKPLLNICGSNKCFSRTNFDGGCCAPRVKHQKCGKLIHTYEIEYVLSTPTSGLSVTEF